MTKRYIKLLGLLIVSLLCACGGGGSKTKATVSKNQAPVAVITVDAASIVLDDSLTISGVKSSDPDGDPLTYQWAIKTETGDDYPLENSATDSFTFTPTDFGIYTITLIVKDNSLTSKAIVSTVTVEPNAQSYPIASVSNDMQTKVGDVSWVSAENSRAAVGQRLTYHWAISSKPEPSDSTVGDADKVKAYLIPDVAGSYEVTLTVKNAANQLTASKKLTITAEKLLVNSKPVAVISTPMPSYAIGQTIRLNATTSYDSDGDQLNYLWTITPPTAGQDIQLSGHTTEFVEFSALTPGDYRLNLAVTDGSLSAEVSTTITVTSDNIPPVANAGEDKVINLGIALELDGSASSDADGDKLQYKWHVVSTPATSTYENHNDFNTFNKFSFMADVMGQYVLALQVFDGLNYSTMDQVHIEVIENQKPVAVLPGDIAIQNIGPQTITSTESYDPEGKVLTYSWQMIAKPEGSAATALSPTGIATTQFTVDLAGTYIIQLIVNDGVNDSLPATMSVVYTPEVWYERNVTGQLINAAGLPVPMAKVDGFFQKEVTSDENGYFTILLKSRREDSALSTLFFHIDDNLSTILRLSKDYESALALGKVTVPVLQQKNLSLTACPGYNGAETVTISFYLTNAGYGGMTFPKLITSTLTVGNQPIAVKLPATGVINMRLSASVSGQVYVENGDTFFAHQHQIDDSQVDPLTITVCN